MPGLLLISKLFQGSIPHGGGSGKDGNVSRNLTTRGREIPDLIEWLPSLTGIWRSVGINSEFNQFRLRKTSIVVYDSLMWLLAMLIVVFVVDILYMLPFDPVYSVVLLTLFSIAFLSLFVSTTIKVHKLYNSSIVKSEISERGSNETVLDQWVAIESISQAEIIIENLTLWVLIVAIEGYIVMLALVSNNSNSLQFFYERGSSAMAIATILPCVLFMVLKRVHFRGTVFVSVLILICNIFVFVYHGRVGDTIRFLLQFLFVEFVHLEYLRHSWHSFLTTRRLALILDENERLADEIKSNELRHMIGNVAHDLKTVSVWYCCSVDN
jgi:signal transduction histidine kinase